MLTNTFFLLLGGTPWRTAATLRRPYKRNSCNELAVVQPRARCAAFVERNTGACQVWAQLLQLDSPSSGRCLRLWQYHTENAFANGLPYIILSTLIRQAHWWLFCAQAPRPWSPGAAVQELLQQHG
jgi:hypothetical protein